MTQWMGLGDACKCALLSREPNSPRLKVQPQVKKDCSMCGKRLPEPSGSLTHWVFSGDTCACKKMMLRDKTKKPSLVEMTRDLKKYCTDTLTSIDTGNFGFGRNGKINRIDHQDLIATRSGDDNETLVLSAPAKPPEMKYVDPVERKNLRDGILFWGIFFSLVFTCCIFDQNSIERARRSASHISFERTKPLGVHVPATGVGNEGLNVFDRDWHAEDYKRMGRSSFVLDKSSTYDDYVEESPSACTNVMLGSLNAEQIRSLAEVDNAAITMVSTEVHDKNLAELALMQNIYSLDLLKSSGFSSSGIKALAKSKTLKLLRFRSQESKVIRTAFGHGEWRRVPDFENFIYVYRR